MVEINTAIIFDHNANPVPDGTPVEFMLSYQSEGAVSMHNAVTVGGAGSVRVTLDRLGVLNIEAISEPARLSEILQLNVQEGIVTVITPTTVPTGTPAPTSTPVEQTPTPQVNAGVVAAQYLRRPRSAWEIWLWPYRQSWLWLRLDMCSLRLMSLAEPESVS